MSAAGEGFRCRSCGTPADLTFIDLGVMPSANAYRRLDETQPERPFPLRTVVCPHCRLVQVDYDVPPADLFTDYAYFSSYSTSWVEHARRFCVDAQARFGLGPQSLVIEAASNDGYLLKHFVGMGVPVLGIEPAANVAEVAIAAGVPTQARFFGKDTAEDLVKQGYACDLFVGNNVLAHVPDLNDFLAGVAVILKPGATFSFEFPHLLRLIAEVQFDTIYHEHFSYFSLLAVEAAMARHGLRLVDVAELPTHGGSLRIQGGRIKERTEPDGAGLIKVRAAEAAAGLAEDAVYREFTARAEACRASVQAFIAEAKAAGKTIVGYGAAAKGNTLLNFCGVKAGDLDYVVDRNPHKQNRLLPGSGAPVHDPEKIFATKPDYLLILPWNLKAEIMEQMAGIRAWGGRFVTPVPKIEVLP